MFKFINPPPFAPPLASGLLCAFLAFFAAGSLQQAPEIKTERGYQEFLNVALQGEMEHRLKDKTRVDILTEDLAIEIDFASKWYEAIGQATHYALMTNKPPGVLLIVRKESDEKYIKAARNVCRNTRIELEGKSYGITLFVFRDLEE